MGHKEHKEAAPSRLTFVVVTVSDTRNRADDVSGKLLEELILDAGHALLDRHLVKDDRGEIEPLVTSLLGVEEADVIILTGGSGIAKRDVTVESIAPLLEKRIEGFGELFRHLSYLQIGSPAILSRAMAGVAAKKIVISIPGSEKAVRLAMEEIILPEAGHMVLEARK